MDLSLLLVGALSAIGFNLNKTVDGREYTKRRTRVPDSEITDSIYEHNNFKRVSKIEKSKLDKYYEETPFIVGTNTLKVTKNITDTTHKQPISVKFIQDQEYQPKKQKIYTGPMFKGDSSFYSVEREEKPFSEGFSGDSGLIGGPVAGHTNMTPFFGGHVKESRDVGTLGRYTGEKGKKGEVKSVLNPKQNIYGKQNDSALAQSRVAEGRYYSNVLPFQQVSEQPIQEDYNRGQSKNVDELRAATNPRTENLGRMTPGSGNYTRADTIGESTSVFTPTVFETRKNYPGTNKDPKSQLVTNYTAKETNKSLTSATYQMNPGFDYVSGNTIRATNVDDGTGTYIYPSTKQTTEVQGFRNGAPNIQTMDPSRQDYIYVPGQERDTANGMRFGNSTDKTFGQRISSTDKPRTTIKELTSYSYIPGGNSTGEFKPSSREHLKTFESKDRASTSGYIPSGNTKQVNLIMPNISSKERSQSNDYFGVGGSVVKSAGVYGSETTKKNPTAEYDFSNRIGPVK